VLWRRRGKPKKEGFNEAIHMGVSLRQKDRADVLQGSNVLLWYSSEVMLKCELGLFTY